ncbi:hypothetical protein ACHAWF_007005, partial [Thalassiosira exigua]
TDPTIDPPSPAAVAALIKITT